MTAVFQKLNFRNHPEIYVLEAPIEFAAELEQMRKVTTIHTSLAEARDAAFVLTFATRQDQVDAFADAIVKAVISDAIVWVAFPKSSSRRLQCEFNRDNGWARMGHHGFEPVRMVAMDADWTALRFRRAEHITRMTRGFAISAEGKRKTGKA